MTPLERREQITAEIVERTGITEAMIDHLVRAFLCQGLRRRGACAGVRCTHPRLGAASLTDVRLLVIGHADDRALSWHSDGQAHALAD